jgi:hypothetical protein
MYAALPYALAQGDVEVPYIVVQTIIYTVITYFMMGFVVDAGAALDESVLSPSFVSQRHLLRGLSCSLVVGFMLQLRHKCINPEAPLMTWRSITAFTSSHLLEPLPYY